MVTPMGRRVVPHVLVEDRFSAAWGAVERQDLPCLVLGLAARRGLGNLSSHVGVGSSAVVISL